MRQLALWLFAILLVCIPACSHKVVFDNMAAAQAKVLGKSGHDTMVALGIPDSVTAGGKFPNGTRYTECWVYRRTARQNANGNLTTLNIYFVRGKAAQVTIEDE